MNDSGRLEVPTTNVVAPGATSQLMSRDAPATLAAQAASLDARTINVRDRLQALLSGPVPVPLGPSAEAPPPVSTSVECAHARFDEIDDLLCAIESAIGGSLR